MSHKTLFRLLGVLLLVLTLVGTNMAIYYSSIPHYEQMGWAIFCGVNAIWIGVIGVLMLVYSESHEVAMRDLNERNLVDMGA